MWHGMVPKLLISAQPVLAGRMHKWAEPCCLSQRRFSIKCLSIKDGKKLHVHKSQLRYTMFITLICILSCAWTRSINLKLELLQLMFRGKKLKSMTWKIHTEKVSCFLSMDVVILHFVSQKTYLTVLNYVILMQSPNSIFTFNLKLLNTSKTCLLLFYLEVGQVTSESC